VHASAATRAWRACGVCAITTDERTRDHRPPRDALVWLNGCFIGRHSHGYTPCRFELTDFVNVGRQCAGGSRGRPGVA
jgi:hypothetical protein